MSLFRSLQPISHNLGQFPHLMCLILLLSGCQLMDDKSSGSVGNAAQLDSEANIALEKLYNTTPSARHLAAKAKGILVFPNVIKAGFIGGAEYGKGVMRKNGRTTGYYNIVAGSYGLQAGVQSFDYAMFFMNEAALLSLNSSKGFEIGVGPNIVVMDEGIAKSVTSTTVLEDVYAFVFGQKGLMAGLGLQGSKITRIQP